MKKRSFFIICAALIVGFFISACLFLSPDPEPSSPTATQISDLNLYLGNQFWLSAYDDPWSGPSSWVPIYNLPGESFSNPAVAPIDFIPDATLVTLIWAKDEYCYVEGFGPSIEGFPGGPVAGWLSCDLLLTYEPTPIPTLIIGDLIGFTIVFSATPINILGFDDFCWDGVCYKNPSADIAKSFSGESVTIDNYQEYKFYSRPTVGIGLDPTATVARIDSRAFGLSSRVFHGGDAGTFSCGELLYRALIANSCSLFVHVPPKPTEDDRAVVIKAIKLVQECVNN
ncbi:hypothetical protein ES703_55234 [subsurface metagenome]